MRYILIICTLLFGHQMTLADSVSINITQRDCFSCLEQLSLLHELPDGLPKVINMEGRDRDLLESTAQQLRKSLNSIENLSIKVDIDLQRDILPKFSTITYTSKNTPNWSCLLSSLSQPKEKSLFISKIKLTYYYNNRTFRPTPSMGVSPVFTEKFCYFREFKTSSIHVCHLEDQAGDSLTFKKFEFNEANISKIFITFFGNDSLVAPFLKRRKKLVLSDATEKRLGKLSARGDTIEMLASFEFVANNGDINVFYVILNIHGTVLVDVIKIDYDQKNLNDFIPNLTNGIVRLKNEVYLPILPKTSPQMPLFFVYKQSGNTLYFKREGPLNYSDYDQMPKGYRPFHQGVAVVSGPVVCHSNLGILGNVEKSAFHKLQIGNRAILDVYYDNGQGHILTWHNSEFRYEIIKLDGLKPTTSKIIYKDKLGKEKLQITDYAVYLLGNQLALIMHRETGKTHIIEIST